MNAPGRLWVQQARFQFVGWVAVFGLLTMSGCGSSSSTPRESDPPRVAEQAEAQPASSSEPPAVEPGDDSDAASLSDRSTVIARADALASQNRYSAAISELRTLLVVDPTDAEILFRLANLEAVSGNLLKAIELLDEIPADHPQAGMPALGQSADWCVQLERYDEAESRYRKVLAFVPQAAPALRNLAYILNRQGRRHEAAEFVRELCKLGNVQQDELHSLIALSEPMYDDPDDPSSADDGDRPYWPIGAAGLARKRFSEREFAQVIDLLHPSVADGSSSQASLALYGLASAEAQDDQRFQWWLSQTGAETQQFAEYWAALGTYLLAHQEFRPAIRALGEAIERDITDVRSISRLRQAFIALKQNETVERLTELWELIRESRRLKGRIASSNNSDLDAITELASTLQALDRPLEALLWQAVEQHLRNAPPSQRSELNESRLQLLAAGKLFPDSTTRLCGIEIDQFPLPALEAVERSKLPIAREQMRPSQPEPAVFFNAAAELGLDHTYRVAAEPQQFGFAVYQMLGGAVVAFDYDLDGNCDLYLAQGAADPPSYRGQQTNQLYRHSGSALTDVTEAASVSEFQYTTGATAGDWNQDGFPDLVVTSIGVETLLINNGDGTFTSRQITAAGDINRLPSSVAMADLNEDGLPDIYQANYVDDSRLPTRPPMDSSGRPIEPILPLKFDPGSDRVFENDGTGDVQVHRISRDRADDSTSLGLVITDFDDKPGLEIFVANDMRPNQLWVKGASDDWVDVAPLRGCAFSHTGSATAAMGVAAGDFVNNGKLDLHITNYDLESASLFLNDDGAFQDRNIQYQIAEPSRTVLGFGTQPIDYNNDGRRDLVVTNGHIDDAVTNHSPFRQSPQLFSNLGGRFQLAEVDDASNYWSSKHLGRGLATLDFDLDGKLDVVVSHIEEPTALLLNRTPSDHHWLQLKLVGTESERDAIGARIRIKFGARELTEWVIAGNGYLCHNERVASFGLGEASMIEALEIRWPTGELQVFRDVPADQRLMVIEGQAKPFSLN